MSKYTPGELDPNNPERQGVVVPYADNVRVSETSQEAEAKQTLREIVAKYERIVNAAPDMLFALESVSRWCHQGHGNFPAQSCGLCKPVFAALARAKGT